MRRLVILLLAIAGLTTGCLGGGNVFSLSAGDCFNDPDTFGEVSDVELVDCGDPHDNEVYALFDIAADDYPGDAAVQDEAAEGCLAAFEGYVGRDYQSSSLDISALTPTSESWDQGDKEVVCFLFDLNFEPLPASARNSGI